MKLRANFNWKITLFVVILLPVLINLGFWQLDRADEKRATVAQQEALMAQPVINYEYLTPEQFQNYQNVKAVIEYRPEIILLDNQMHNGKFGYEVIQAAKLKDGQVLFISRGWVPGSLDRQKLPEITAPKGKHVITGYLYQQQANLSLGAEAETNAWPRVMASVSVEKLYNAIGKNDKIPPPFLVRLDYSSQGVFENHWVIVNNPPEKHEGYAFQWFGMAALLVFLYILASIKRVTD